jgi:NAD-dependent deacetylase
MDDSTPDLSRYLEIVRSAARCAVFTGAGVSAESGMPTFRGENGLWKEYRAEELATPEAFARNPDLVYEWYDYRRGIVAGVEPNPGHEALARAEALFEEFTLITQNVDGLHQEAGSSKVIELHGNIRRDRCNVCGRKREDPGASVCACGGPWRPDVVWFGESLPLGAMEEAFRAVATADLVFTAGTSTQVYPAAQIPYAAREHGAWVVEINPEPTPFTPLADLSIRGPSGEWLPRLLDPDVIRPGGGTR